MSHISYLGSYVPFGINLELQQTDRKDWLLWVVGDRGVWRHVIKNIPYHIIFFNKSLRFKTSRYQTLVKYYFPKLHKISLYHLSMKLSLLTILTKRMFVGINPGYKKYLRVKGVGYRFEINNVNHILSAKVGWSHLLSKKIPSEFKITFSRKSKAIRLRSRSLNLLTGLLAYLRRKRQPDVYKGKGIRYRKDTIKLRIGKKKKSTSVTSS